ncbi:hypothetical protein JOC33_002948 [Thalassobacillus pellis]|nr:hypothetical protein [Thalassobacillus pellis]
MHYREAAAWWKQLAKVTGNWAFRAPLLRRIPALKDLSDLAPMRDNKGGTTVHSSLLYGEE